MRVGGSSSCVSDAPTLRFQQQQQPPPPKTDGRARPLHGVALPLRDRLALQHQHHYQHQQENYVSAGQEHKHLVYPVRPSTDPRGFIPDGASHHRHGNPWRLLSTYLTY